MKTWTLRFRTVDKKNFYELRRGIKSVETRAASTKYQPIEKGDTLIFVCGKDKFSKIITKKSHFKSIDAMFRKIPFKKIMPDLRLKEEARNRYYSYPNYREKIQEFGILAFELKNL
jgi:ASC-1-like (ASCH) protein